MDGNGLDRNELDLSLLQAGTDNCWLRYAFGRAWKDGWFKREGLLEGGRNQKGFCRRGRDVGKDVLGSDIGRVGRGREGGGEEER